MEVKRYVGSDMKDIMNQIRSEMGSDAVILHTGKTRSRGLKGWFSRPLIEVIAARDHAVGIRADIDNSRLRSMEIQLSRLNEAVEKVLEAKKESGIEQPEPFYKQYLYKLIERGVAYDVASEILNRALKRDSGDGIEERLKGVVKEYLGRAIPITLDNSRQNIIIFLGPTGVGKTTTLAKLAAYYGIQLNKKVALITADTYRIAAVEQLRTYGDIMQMPLSVVYSSSELEREINRYIDADMIMIDTAGRSPKDIGNIEDIKRLVKISKATDVFLLVGAAFNYASCRRLWEHFSDIDDLRLLFTKVDETEAWGTILNMCYISKKPLSYITTGQTVPDDIQIADIDTIAAKIVRG